ncbi:zinc-ribbon domain-containing protein [Ligilactobacillus equi]|uniref:zinc-ribbon domain-containing protein n=2 Tax=Ligilactobacillus equi TaxID=137357 RepID=UPI000704A71A|nr:zinc-ribbon domain-containing protein [Ligilactobacillus equi]
MNNKFCIHCGNQIIPGAKFCSACGQPVVEDRQVNPNQVNGSMPNQNFGSNPNDYHQGSMSANSANSFSSAFTQAKEYYEETKRQYSHASDQELGFIGSFKYYLVHWLDFQGIESRKSVFWWGVLGSMLTILVGMLLCTVVSVIPILGQIIAFILIIVLTVFIIINLIAEYAACARRMRYLNVQNIGMWLILTLLLSLPGFYTFLYLMLIDQPLQPSRYQAPYPQQPGTPYQNQSSYPNQTMSNPSINSSESASNQNFTSNSQF